MHETPRKATTINSLFAIAMVGKAVDGLLEIIVSFLLFFVSPEQLNWILRAVTQHEFSKDPHDVLASLLLHSVRGVSVGTWKFAAVFLLWHGAVKVSLVTALLLKLLWAYPLAVVAFSLFLVYQVYCYLHTYSVWLLVLSVLDLFVIVVTWLEYNRSRTSRDWNRIPLRP